ncbi:425_t:CDS:2, partial [Dentiscutata erythropus]
KEKTGTIAGEPSKDEKKQYPIEESVTKERLYILEEDIKEIIG